jgi:putative chitinase
MEHKMFTLTSEDLGKIINRNVYKPKQDDMVDALNNGMVEGEVTTALRAAMFLAQVLHETGSFKWFTELGNDGYFAKYNGRKDLGNTQPNDGPRFRGRGFIQITGRANYTIAAKALGLDLVNHPEIAADLTPGARIAGWYWKTRNLNVPADAGDIKRVTKLINGGYNGLDDRIKWYEKAKDAFGLV